MTARREEGFVLVATIWFVALLAVVAVIIAGWLERSLGRATALKDRVAAHGEMIGTVDRVAFLMLTGYYSPRGIEVGNPGGLVDEAFPNTLDFARGAGTPYIGLDDQPYRAGAIILRLQDDHGLLNLSYPDGYFLSGVLRQYGVSDNDTGVLLDRLLDYTNKSPLIHLNGASVDSYIRAGRPAPRDNPLLTPWEPHRVLGWDEYANLWKGPEPFSELVSVRAIAGLNPNTAPAAVLRAIPGLDENAVDHLLNYRATRLILQPTDLDIAAGMAVPVDPLRFNYFPADSLRLTMMAARYPLVREVVIRLTPIGTAPFRIDYVVERPQTVADRALLSRTGITVLPMPADIPSPEQKPVTANLAGGG
ncbi:MAG: general secretion pathway protein GspK [Alphaproteobacteria bacterium]|nr:general secretion pathway protein GspK [Alphaproteobacteria bacterium]